MDFAVTTEVDRRAWAVERAIGMGSPEAELTVIEVVARSNALLAYVSTPIAEGHSKLIDAARSYDGTVNASALIGALADALERR